MLITNGRITTFGESNKIIHNGALRIEEGLITDIGSTDELVSLYPLDDRTDAGGQLVMPGNICAHTHFYGAFARGLAIPGSAPRDFPAILEKLWWRLDRGLCMEDVENSALVCLIDAIKHGTTTLIDHHASPAALIGSLDRIAHAVDQAGMRACLCYEVTDRNGKDEAVAGIEENVRFAQYVKNSGNPRLAASFGLHASLTLSDQTLMDAVEAERAVNTGFHIHAAEGIADQEDCLNRTGMRVIERLQHAGILGSKTILAHCVHVDSWEMEILRDTGTWVTHQPRSNMNNAVGVAPVPVFLRGGIRVGMGNDGFSNNMWAEWKAAYFLHKLHQLDPRAMGGYDILKIAVENNAALAKKFWPDHPLGELTPGAYADVIFVDYKPFTQLTPENLPWHILFGFEADAVTATMVHGKWLMKDRKLLTLDESKITRTALRLSQKTWERFHSLSRF